MSQQLEMIVPGLYRWHSRQTSPHAPVNSYLIAEPDGLTVIDPSHDLSPGKLAAHGLEPVRRILVTHVQREHVAGCTHFSGVPIHIPVGGEYLAQGPTTYRSHLTPWPEPWEWHERGNYKGHMAGAANERPSDVPLNLATSLTPGDRVNGFDVLATPGHGKHAVTLLKSIGGLHVAFCGDLIYGDAQLWNWFDAEWDYGPETGQRALRRSLDALASHAPQLLCPSHGPVINTPSTALRLLSHRLDQVLTPLHGKLEPDAAPQRITTPQPILGWTQLLPSLYQWQAHHGNCNVLLSRTGNALMIDDGLCTWLSIPQRRTHHQKTIEQLKRTLGIDHIEIVIPTHYHGDHIEHIPLLIEHEQTRVIALDIVAAPIEHPERFNLACPLPWYDTGHNTFTVDQKVCDGQRIHWHEYELELFHLGGQTYYHAGIAVRIDGQDVVFAGDAINSAEPGCPSVICYNDAEPATRGWAYAMRRLLERPANLLVAGHGLALNRPRAMLEINCQLWQQRIAQFEALNPRASMRWFFDPFFTSDNSTTNGEPMSTLVNGE